jgi:hypothetical protein
MENPFEMEVVDGKLGDQPTKKRRFNQETMSLHGIYGWL